MKRFKGPIILFSIIIIMVLVMIGLTKLEAFQNWAKRFDKSDVKYDVVVDMNEETLPELTVLYPNSGMSDSTFQDSWTTRYFEKTTKYKVKYYQTLGEQGDRVNTILAGEEPYHMLKLESGTFLKNQAQGAFVNLRPALEEYGQDLLKTIPQEAWDAVTDPATGAIYGIPEVGFSGMIGHALVWNLEQLNAAGITKIPETITEVTEALYALQNTFYKAGGTYHAFTMAGAQAYMSNLAAAWDLPENFYVNEKNEVSHTMYHPQYKPYMQWVNQLIIDGVCSGGWKGYTNPDLISKFSKEEFGCVFMNYWSINDIVKKLAQNKGISEDAARKLVGWTVYVKGDGNYGTPVQEEAKFVSYSTIGYYCAVPVHMAADTSYVIDWMNKRITVENFEGYRLGDEGVHFQYTDSTDPNAIKVQLSKRDENNKAMVDENGKVIYETKYVKTLPAYEQVILPTSMYQCGVNPDVGKNLWILSEKTYNAWEVMVDNDSPNALGNALSMAPYIKGWSEIDIEARSWVLTLEQQILINTDASRLQANINTLKGGWKGQYWKKDVNAAVQAWYQSK